jgi:hypothetical protein
VGFKDEILRGIRIVESAARALHVSLDTFQGAFPGCPYPGPTVRELLPERRDEFRQIVQDCKALKRSLDDLRGIFAQASDSREARLQLYPVNPEEVYHFLYPILLEVPKAQDIEADKPPLQCSVFPGDVLLRMAYLRRDLGEHAEKPAPAKSGGPGEVQRTVSPEKVACLPPKQRAAWLEHETVSIQHTELSTDGQAYEWLALHGSPEDRKLPSKGAWERALRRARESLGQQKNRPRSGRTGRSVRHRKDL